MYRFGMVGYITIILLIVGAVFLIATKVTGKAISLAVSLGILAFIGYVLVQNGIIVL